MGENKIKGETKGAKGGKCPNCGAAREHKYRPFCSPRCKDVDLGRWFKGAYAVATEETPETEESGDDDGPQEI